MRRISITFFAFILFAICSFAQEVVIKGKIIDTHNRQPVMFATIKIVGEPYGTITDDEGIFSLALTQKDVTLSIREVGYKEKTLKSTDFKEGDIKIITLVPTQRFLKEVTVTALTPQAILKRAYKSIKHNYICEKYGVDLLSCSIVKINDTIRNMVFKSGVYTKAGYMKGLSNDKFSSRHTFVIASDTAFAKPWGQWDKVNWSYLSNVDWNDINGIDDDLEWIDECDISIDSVCDSIDSYYILTSRSRRPQVKDKEFIYQIPAITRYYICCSDLAFVKQESVLDSVQTDYVKYLNDDQKKKFTAFYSVVRWERVNGKYCMTNAFQKYKYLTLVKINREQQELKNEYKGFVQVNNVMSKKEAKRYSEKFVVRQEKLSQMIKLKEFIPLLLEENDYFLLSEKN